MDNVLLIGADDVQRAGNAMREAAREMTAAAAHIENVMFQRRQWEEEYLARIEAIVREELDFYKPPAAQGGEPQ